MKIKKNEYLVQQNEKNNQIGFVVSGIFRLSHTDANGNTWIVGYSFANDFVCDYPSFMKQTVSTVTIQASTECEVYLLPLSKLNQFWETTIRKANSRNYVCRNISTTIGILLRYSGATLSCINEKMPRFTRKAFIQRNSPVSWHNSRNPQQNKKKTTV